MYNSRAAAFRRSECLANQPRVMCFIERIDPESTVASRVPILRRTRNRFELLAMFNQNTRVTGRAELIGQAPSYALRVSKNQPRLFCRHFVGRGLQLLRLPGNLIQPAAGIDRRSCRAAPSQSL